MSFDKHIIKNGWVICDQGVDFKKPKRACTFAFDTESIILFDDKQIPSTDLYHLTRDLATEEKRKRVSTVVWAWQCYDEINGFFMTNNFDAWLNYQALCGYEFGWCYNAKFDFSQIDYQILTNPKWQPLERPENGRAYNRGQPWAYESLHSDMGARYGYKLWIQYRNTNRHKYVHAVEYRDMMNIFAGGLGSMLESLDVRDNDGNEIRKLEMEYQSVNPDALTDEEINYCLNDVKGLYFAIKMYNKMIEEQSDGECHIFGEKTNIMTAGGFAKRMLLRSLYPDIKPSKRLQRYQQQHPMMPEQDRWLRKHHLYRGGISAVNPLFCGKLLTSDLMGRPMNRYDVNSEYPFAMSEIRDLVGEGIRKKYSEWLAMDEAECDNYECIMVLTSVSGKLKPGFVPVWYDPFMHDYVEVISEDEKHLMFEREMDEMMIWYDLDFECDDVILYRRGEKVYQKFVYENYDLKTQAKRQKNGVLSAVVKLLLNSSYGKLSERCERRTGHYTINPETGCVHMVYDGKETDTKGIMSVAVGALITAVARIWILSHIREICGEGQISSKFVYIDTDSIHAFADYKNADPYTLGGLKHEATCPAVKYLAPKTYVDIETVNNGFIPIDGEKINAEFHTKGINIKSVVNDMISYKTKLVDSNKTRYGVSIDYINKRFDYNQKFTVLCAMNVIGGKVLIPTDKVLANYEIDDNEMTIESGYDGMYLSEV